MKETLIAHAGLRAPGCRRRAWTAIAVLGLAGCAGLGGHLDAQGIVSLHSFSGYNNLGHNVDGGAPQASLVLGPDGDFYGTTSAGGSYGDGTIFRMSPTGAGTVLHEFDDTDNGFYQYSGLAVGPDGNLYGTTFYGGANGTGSIYQITPKGAYQTIYSFTAVTNGENSDGTGPWAGLVYDAATGLFYGTTQGGGANGYGTVYSVTTGGSLNPMYSFANAVTQNSPDGDGNTPQAVLAIGPDGALYGTTDGGGKYDAGTAFRITTGGSFHTIHVFTQGDDGGAPNGLTLGSDQNLYGTGDSGGQYNYGNVFMMTTGGAVTPLYSFTEGSDGAFPLGGVIFGPGGLLYGTTSNAGAGGNAAGTVYSLPASGGTPTIIYTFGNVWSMGAYPSPALVSGPAGKDGATIYGVTTSGGKDGNGTVFGVVLPAVIAPIYPGTYDGLFVDNSGCLSIDVTDKGKFTGKVIVGSATHSLKGQFDISGAWEGQSTDRDVSISLQLGGGQGGTPGSYYAAGTANATAVTAYHAEYAKGIAVAETGTYKLQLTPTIDDPTIPQNPSNATLTVSKTGSVHLAGKLPDGTAFSASTLVVGGAAGDQCPIYSNIAYKDATPKGARGFAVGPITFPGGAVTGPLTWTKPAQTKGAYPAAIETGLTVSQ